MSYTIYRKITLNNPQSRLTDCVALIPAISAINLSEEAAKTLDNFFKKERKQYVLVENEFQSLPKLLEEARAFEQAEALKLKEKQEKEEELFKSLTKPATAEA